MSGKVNNVERSATDEMRIIYSKYNMFHSIFRYYIDISDNSEVDINQWRIGLLRINVNMNDLQMRKSFNIIASTNEYMDISEFMVFVTLESTNSEIIELQKPITDACYKANMYLRDRSKDENLNCRISLRIPKNVEDKMLDIMYAVADDEHTHDFKTEMKNEVESMHAVKININISNAMQWSNCEVGLWVNSLNLDFNYSTNFADEGVDGDKLLFYVEEDVLLTTLGVHPIHAKYIMEHLCKLRLHVLYDAAAHCVRKIEDGACKQNDFKQAFMNLQNVQMDMEILAKRYNVARQNIDEQKLEIEDLKLKLKNCKKSDSIET